MLNQRKIALEALLAVNEDSGYSNIVLSKFLSDNDVPRQDRAFISALYYGVLDRIITLDYIISAFTNKPVKRIKPLTLNSLRMAVFQIVYMDKVPDSAAVNEAVKLVKSSKENYNASFVNAVLRNILRTGVKLPEDNSAESLSVCYSCPAWIIESFIADYGIDNTVNILKHFLETPLITVRINPLLIGDEEFKECLSDCGIEAMFTEVPHAAILAEGVDLTALSQYRDGLFHVQDIPSQIAVSKLGLRAGESLLDMCAAPGGKTFTAAEIADDNAKIIACDVFPHRVELIATGAKRLNIKSITAKICDSSVFDQTLGLFDAVICDVPCSGLGVIRRKPEIKYKKDIRLDVLQDTQLKILSNGIKYLKPGGRLLYSTCTLRKAENEEIVRRCLNENEHIKLCLEHTFLPGIDGTDGFYFAILKSG